MNLLRRVNRQADILLLFFAFLSLLLGTWYLSEADVADAFVAYVLGVVLALVAIIITSIRGRR